MFKFRFPHKPNAKTKLARRVFFVRKRTLAIPAGLAAVCALCLITTLPSYVSAASTQRQPIHFHHLPRKNVVPHFPIRE